MNNDKDNTGDEKDVPLSKVATRTMRKTPMYTAMHASRYERQELIRSINDHEETHLICYVAGANTQINRDDVIGLVDLLHNVDTGKPVDLLLHTCGGDVDACEKLVALIRAKVGEGQFRVIVPDLAKSAGTLLALAANTVIMSDSSELGMIDPQYQMRDNQGNEIWHSVIAYLEAYEEHKAVLESNPKNRVAMLMLGNFDAKVVRKFKGIRDRVRTFAERLLNQRGLPSSKISQELMSASRWRTHGQPIMHADAKELGLPIEYLSANDERWARYWRLYCLQRLEVADDKKIFESVYVSQVFEN